jgi:hypothetical protein
LEKLDQKENNTIRLPLLDSILLNVLREATTKYLWNRLRDLYQSKSLVKKIFLCKNLYNLRMKYGDSVKEHVNAFNIVVNKLLYVDINISNEDKCIIYYSLYQNHGIIMKLL